MDNNNFNNVPQGQPMQPNSGMNPNMQSGMPMGQGMPMGSGSMPGGQMNYNGQMGQPMQPNVGQLYSQSMVKPPKKPMDPAKKKRIIIIICVISILLVVGIALAIILPIVLRVDYSTAYNTAKELKPNIYDIYHDYDCEYVVDDVDLAYVSANTYDGYIEGCKELYNGSTDELINDLENTDGVKRNDEIKAKFADFKNEYLSLFDGNVDGLDDKLELWRARHNFVLAADNLTYSSSDAEFTNAANILINTGNEALKTYGEGWMEWKITIAAAYRAYNNASWTNYNNYKALRDTYENKKAEFSDWLAANKPDIREVAPLNFGNTSKMYTAFNSLYDLIAKTYELNYNYGSNDCSEFMGEVYCE